MEIIELNGITATGFHGVYEEERESGQVFIADVHCVLRRESEADELATTVNYAELAGRIEAIITGAPLALLETLAARIAEECLSEELIVQVRVRVRKPQVDLPGHASVAVVHEAS